MRVSVYLRVCVHKWSTRLNSPISSHTLANRACLSADKHSHHRCTFCLLYLLLAALTLPPAIPLPPPHSSLLPYLKRHLSPRAISVICVCLCVPCTSGGCAGDLCASLKILLSNTRNETHARSVQSKCKF